MTTKRGSRIIIEELGLIDIEEFQDRLETRESLKEICAQLHLLINQLVDQEDVLAALSVITVVVKTIRTILGSRGSEIKAIITSLKRKAGKRAILRVREKCLPVMPNRCNVGITCY